MADSVVSAPVSVVNQTIVAGVVEQTGAISAAVTTEQTVINAPVVLGMKGDKGASPVLSWIGDQIAVNGVVSGPHLTGPAGVAAQTLVIGPDFPDFGGDAGLFVQTGLPGDGVTFWIEDGN